MHAPRRWALLVLVAACGGGGGPSGDDGNNVADDAPAADDASVQSTMVTGSVDGTPFSLTHASVGWPSADSRTWICVSDEPVAFDVCLDSSGPSRVVLHGPFVVPESGTPAWVVPQVGLYRVGPSASSDIADAATLNLIEYSPTDGRLALTLEVDFADNGIVSGSVSVP